MFFQCGISNEQLENNFFNYDNTGRIIPKYKVLVFHKLCFLIFFLLLQ